MKSCCVKCGELLPQFRLLRNTCRNCGASYRAVRGRSWPSRIYGAIYGAAGIVIIPIGIMLPWSFWFGLFAFPFLYILGGIILSMKTQKWVLS